MKSTLISCCMLVALALASPASAQFGNLGKLGQAVGKMKDARQAFVFTDQEEEQLGMEISAKLRDKYGVVQDPAVHKYVTLVGMVLAQASSRPNLTWTFIVLDTDGINAFAAPGGFVHITRGALALMQNESELADVLGHEISHVTLKHTIAAIQKSKKVSLLADATKSDIMSQAVNLGYDVVQNGFDQHDELEADQSGVALANGVGYSPLGLGVFLKRLEDRNKDLKDPSGLFASHPATTERLDDLTKVIAGSKLNATAVVDARFHESITFKPIPVTSIGQPAASAKPANSGGGKLGLGGLSSLGKEKSSDQTVSSAGSRGVNPDRDAPGGPVKTLVAVTVTAAEIADFRKGISG